MPRLIVSGFAFLLALATLSVLPARALSAQQSDSTVSQEAMLSFAKTHVAVSALRDRYQTELAEPRNKKGEVQNELRAKLHSEIVALLKSQGFSEAEFAHMTRRVSEDEGARKAFEAALAQLAEKK